MFTDPGCRSERTAELVVAPGYCTARPVSAWALRAKASEEVLQVPEELLTVSVPASGWTPRKFRPRRSRRTSPRSWAFELSDRQCGLSLQGVPLTVRREVESWTMETATMPTTPSFFQRVERGLSPAAAMITLHRDLTLRLEGHMAWQAPYFIRMVDDPETSHRKPEYWHRCKVCQKWLDVAHLQGQTHSTNMQAYMQEGNPHLTAEHPLEAIPRNSREACLEGYTDLSLHRIADEFRRIVEAERRRTEPKAKSRPKSPQAKARPAEPKKAKAKSRPKSPQAKARPAEPKKAKAKSRPKSPQAKTRPAESKKAKAPATAKKTKASAAATVEKAEAPEPPVKRAPEAFRRSGVWLEENPPHPAAAELEWQLGSLDSKYEPCTAGSPSSYDSFRHGVAEQSDLP